MDYRLVGRMTGYPAQPRVLAMTHGPALALAAVAALTGETNAPPRASPTSPAPTVPASGSEGFTMQVVRALPPIYEEIALVFPAVKRTRGVVYAWGRILYNPQGAQIPAALMVHEHTHGKRQIENHPTIEAWWARYLDDVDFRMAEETIAHRAEYRARIADAPHRNARRWHLKQTAMRLSGGLYGRAMTYAEAVDAIRATD